MDKDIISKLGSKKKEYKISDIFNWIENNCSLGKGDSLERKLKLNETQKQVISYLFQEIPFKKQFPRTSGTTSAYVWYFMWLFNNCRDFHHRQLNIMVIANNITRVRDLIRLIDTIFLESKYNWEANEGCVYYVERNVHNLWFHKCDKSNPKPGLDGLNITFYGVDDSLRCQAEQYDYIIIDNSEDYVFNEIFHRIYSCPIFIINTDCLSGVYKFKEEEISVIN